MKNRGFYLSKGVWIVVFSLMLGFFASCSSSEESSNDSYASPSPQVLSTTPSDNDTEVNINSPLTLVFDISMDNSSMTLDTENTDCSGSIQMSSDDFNSCVQMLSLTSENESKSFIATPKSDLEYSSTYKIKITREVKSSQGVTLAQEYLNEHGFKTVSKPESSPEATTPDTSSNCSIMSQGSGSVSGSIRDISSGNPISGVSVSFQQNSSEVASATSDANGDITQTLTSGCYVAVYNKAGYISTQVNIEVHSSVTTVIMSLQQIPSTHTGVGSISGAIKDVITDVGISGVTLQVRKEINTQAGEVIATTITDSSGNYSISNLAVGWYTIEGAKTGYDTMYFNVYTLGGETTIGGQDASFSQIIAPETMRIILRWGVTPLDLDSYLTGPDNALGRFKIFYGDPIYTYSAGDEVSLDRDDVDSYGPETITISKVREGTYRYSVHNFTNQYDNASSILSQSGAYLTINYMNQSYRYDVPNQEGTLWEVFSFDGGTGVFTPLNTMTYDIEPDVNLQ